MKKVIYALALFAVAAAANAAPINFVSHQQSSGTTISTLVTNGATAAVNPGALPAAYGGQVGAVTATFDWDGTTLSSSGNYGAVIHIGSSPFNGAIQGVRVTDLNIDTSANGGLGDASGSTAYSCSSGAFLVAVGFNVCGGYSFGANAIDESTPVWTGTTVSPAFGPFGFLNDNPTSFYPAFVSTVADDGFAGGPSTIAQFDMQLMSWDGTQLILGNGMVLGAGGEQICFRTDSAGCTAWVPPAIPVPAAAWLFGSALGLLGWARRRVAQ